MIQKILSHQSKTLTGAALVLGFASLFSRVVGVLRDRILAHQFGAGSELDIYTAAFRIPDFIYTLLIVGALSAGFIPLFLELYEKNKESAWKFTSRVINLTVLLVAGVSTILYFFTPELVHILVPGFSLAQKQTTVDLTRLMLLSPILLGLSAVVSSVLQSLRSFCMYALAPIFYNLGIIVGAIFLVPHFGLRGLGYGVVLGALMHLLIQLPTLWRAGYRYRALLSIHDKTVVKLSRMMIPRTLTLASVQCTTLLITSFASVLGAGSIAVFTFASNISSLPVGIIGISFALATFPTLSEYANSRDMDAFKKQLALTTRQILFFIIPLTVLFLLLRAQIVRVLLGTGNFSWDNTIMTATTVGMFSLSLFAQCLIPLYSRAFYALKNTRIPLILALLSLFITGFLSLGLKEYFGVAGLALAITVGSIVQLVFLNLSLKKITGDTQGPSFYERSGKMLVAALCMTGVTQLLKYPISLVVEMNTFGGIFLQGLLSGLGGLVVYGVLCSLLQVEEMSLLCQSLRKKWLKLRDIPVESDVLK